MSNQPSTGHPKGLYLLFFTEMWERFSYYGMRAIFTLYMTKALLFDKALSSNIYGSYTGLVYLTPLVGGYVADRYWGNRRSILVGGILMAIGQLFMFFSGMFYQNDALGPLLMFVGLGFLIFGNGFFKPNISTMVGQLYPAGDRRVDAAFSIFYMGINLGAFIAPLICGGLGDTDNPADFKWGFLAAAGGMTISIISFEMLKNKYIVSPTGEPVGTKPKPAAELDNKPKAKISMGRILFWFAALVVLFLIFKGIVALDYVGAFIFSAAVVAPLFIVTDPVHTKEERDRIWVIIVLSFFVIFFWSAFEQAGASLTFFAEEQTDRTIGDNANPENYTVPASYFQSINAVAIVIFAPLFALLWTWLGKRNKEPNSILKQATGLLLLALGYLYIALTVKDMSETEKFGMIVLITLYTVHTFGELCLSPIGLSMVVKLAPVRFASLLMGVWFLSTATANKFAGDLSALYPQDVKQETSVVVKTLPLPDDSGRVRMVTIDSAMVHNLNASASNNVWTVTMDSDDDPKPAEPSFFEAFVANLLPQKEAKSDSVIAIGVGKANDSCKISETRFKQIVPGGAKYAWSRHFSADCSKLYVLRAERKDKKPVVSFEIWNLKPEKPSFLGMQINDLYDFFMIFVYLSGAAALVLFGLVRPLRKMAHGKL